MNSGIIDDIVGLVLSPSVIGLATHRHYPHERMIYSRFGRCGFSIDVLTEEHGSTTLHSILVEAEADEAVDSSRRRLEDSPGKARYLHVVSSKDGKKLSRSDVIYRNSEELFAGVERVRAAFYQKYRELKAKEGEKRIQEEVFHQVGIMESDLYLGV